jgi:hypothetical protein
MSYQFFHYRQGKIFGEVFPKGGATFSVEEVSIDAFDHLSKALGIAVKLRVGVARCSEKDNYNKRIGRLISRSRAGLSSGLKTFLVDQITSFGDERRGLTLTQEDGSIVLFFKNNKGNNKVRLVEAYER